MKVIYVVLVCLLAFTSCAETEYAENGVDKKEYNRIYRSWVL